MNRSLTCPGRIARGRFAALLLGGVLLALAACAEQNLADGFPDGEPPECGACHGGEDSAAPPDSLDGLSDTRALGVGAHQEHLRDGRIRKAVGCRACHAVPAAVAAPGHIDERPAELTWGSLAQVGGVTPAWDRDAGTCSSVYCHGATLAGGSATAPVWTTVDNSQVTCGSCHGAPPPAPHPQADACHDCHPGTVTAEGEIDVEGGRHIDGIVQSAGTGCSGCHGSEDNAAPPVDLAGSSDTGDVTVGAHQAHLRDGDLRVALTCRDCHLVPGTVDAPGHIDAAPAELSWGGLATTDGAEPSWDRAAATCSATYCHGGTLEGGADVAPVWTRVDGSQTTCGSCHGAPPPAPHPQSDACAQCHPDTVTATGAIDVAGRAHINGVVNVIAGSCRACHGSAVNDAPPVALDGAVAPSDPGVGAHQEHLQASVVSGPIACTECHVVPATVDAPGHLDSAPAELVFGTLATANGAEPSYDASANTCATTYCHGGTLSGGQHTTPLWTLVDDSQVTCSSCHGAPPPPPHPANAACDTCHPGTLSGPGTIDLAGGQHIDGEVQLATGCTVCHGSEDGPAPPTDLSGSTDPADIGVGAHTAHVQHGHIRAPLTCGECHPAVESVAGHIDGLPAEIAFGELAAEDGATPAWDRAQARCSSTYCHGATLAGGALTAPVWTEDDGLEHDCGLCHGAPPPAPHPADARCERCHPDTVLADGTIDLPGGQHIDGDVDVPELACNACHGDADGPAPPPDLAGASDPSLVTVGAHDAHVQGGDLRAGMACTECHIVPATLGAPGHLDAPPAEITWGDLAQTGGLGPDWDRETATCSSTYCHGVTLGGGGIKAPVWTIVDGTQAGCGQCHGFPPPAPHPQVFSCNPCHPDTVLPDGSIDVDGGHHVDGIIDAP